MAYFKNFPTITYDFTSKTDAQSIIQTIPDLSIDIGFDLSELDMATLCERYIIQGSELPEHISNKLYKTPDLSWTIVVINRIANISNEWPLSDLELIEFASRKYGSTNLNNIHHYEKLPEGIPMDSSFIISMYGSASLNPVTNVDFETSLNEKKRIIWVIRPAFVNDFVTKYNAVLG